MTAPFRRLGPVARNVGRNLGWMLASRGLAAILSLVYLSIVTRALGLVDFGRFALITGTAQILTTLVAFQSWQIVIQYGVDPARRGDENELARLFLGSTILEFAGALVGVVLAAVIVYVWGDALGIGPTLKRATLIFAVVQLLTIRSTAVGMLRLRDHFDLGAIADSMTPVGRFIGSGLVLLIHPTLQGFLVAWGFAELLAAGAFWWFAARGGDVRLMKRARNLRGLIRDHPGIVGFALSTNANATLGLASKQIPLLLVGGISGPAAAGAFRLAAQISQALAKLSQMVARAAFPEMVRSVQTLTTSTISIFIRRLFVGSAVACAIIMTLVFFVGQQVLTLVGGRGFASAWPIMVWLAAAGCFDLIAVGVETVLTALRRAATVFVIRATSVLVILGTAYALAQSMGGVGVAIAVAIGAGAASVMMAICAVGLKIDTPVAMTGDDIRTQP